MSNTTITTRVSGKMSSRGWAIALGIGAVSDPQFLVGRAAAQDILPGQQFTALDFAASDTASVDSQITGTQRGVALAIGGVNSISSQVQAGDSVDVYIGAAGVVKLFRANVKVLAIPTVPGPVGGGNLIVRVDTKDVANWQYASANSQLWFVIRPVTGAKATKKTTANAATVLR